MKIVSALILVLFCCAAVVYSWLHNPEHLRALGLSYVLTAATMSLNAFAILLVWQRIGFQNRKQSRTLDLAQLVLPACTTVTVVNAFGFQGALAARGIASIGTPEWLQYVIWANNGALVVSALLALSVCVNEWKIRRKSLMHKTGNTFK